jgi:DNA-binding beta-propeller fold protein YncE
VSFSFAFGSKGVGSGEFLHPAGVAIDEASGDAYVVDAGNDRVERFGPAGEFLASWGWGVSDGKAEYEVCTSACKAGLAGEGEGELDAPQAIAVDNSESGEDPSRGDVYVLADTAGASGVVEKFTATGEFLGRLDLRPEPGTLGGVAVDANGNVWVSDLGDSEIARFNDGTPNVAGTPIALQAECAETPGLAVDASGEALYVTHQLPNLQGECPEVGASAKAPALAAKLNAAGGVVSEALDEENTSALAVDMASTAATPLGASARGDVYLDDGTSIAVFNSVGSLVERFGDPEQLDKGAGIAIDSKNGQVDVADGSADRVDVFAPEVAGPPSVDSTSFEDVTPTSTRLLAQVDPHGADTHFYFQYGTGDCATTPEACTDIPLAPGVDIGEGYGAVAQSTLVEGLAPGTTYSYRVIATNANGQAQASQTLATFTTLPSASGLLADNRAWELVSPAEKFGALIYPIGGDSKSAAPASGVIEAASDGDAITYAANAALGEQPPTNRAPEATQVISSRSPQGWSTADIATPHDHAEGIKPPLVAEEYRAFSPDLSQALVQPFGVFNNPLQEPPLVGGVEKEERGLYLRHDFTCTAEPSSCYQALLTPADDSTGAAFGGKVNFEGTSENLQHVVFSSDVTLTATLPSAPGLYEWNAGKPDAEALQPVSVLPGNKKSAGEEPPPQLGDFDPELSSPRNAVSEDGSRVIFSALLEEGSSAVTNIYMRDTASASTIQLNVPQGVKKASAPERESEEAHFRDASTDGSRVFFTDTFPLTTTSHLRPSEEGPADLYVCEVRGSGECKLTDLTVDPGFDLGESAEVVGTVLGTSEDGAYVYFVANGVLDAQAQSGGASRGDCAARPSAKPPPGATCNLYLEHYDSQSGSWEAPRFIARLSQEDQPDWGTTNGSLAELTARVSPNGRYLAFMSKEPLTGYDNADQNPEAHGARDEEVYLYDASEGRLVCASCDPNGSQPTGVLDRERSGEGQGLLVDRFGVWQETQKEEQGGERSALDHWLAGSIPGWTPLSARTAIYQSRYLSNEGRLFFDSPADLVAAATNGKEDVYEYEPDGLGTCGAQAGCVALISSGESDHESAFLDASETGNDVFFLTNQPLVPADHDTSYDVYDARVCSQDSPCLGEPPASPAPCQSLETCRPITAAQQSFPAPSGTATLSAPENLPHQGAPRTRPASKPRPLTRAQKLAKALRLCRTLHKHSKTRRHACERRARETYAPRPAGPVAKSGKRKR